MIGRLEGLLAEKQPGELVLDVGGVGYEVRVPLSTFLQLPDEGKTIRLQVHTHVREEALQLFGFASERERAVFRLLLGISGVGPRLALAILSGLPLEQLLGALREADLRKLTAIPGVGRKTAERILVDLRDKLPEHEIDERPSATRQLEEATLSALLNLGYPQAHAERAVSHVLETSSEDTSLEEAIKEALRVAAG